MFRKLLILTFVTVIFSCDRGDTPSSREDKSDVKIDQDKNILAKINTQDMKGLNWMNPPDDFEIHDHSLLITSSTGTDFFNNPEDGVISGSAPLLYKEMTGDFVAITLVKPDFTSVWNAGALMIYLDSAHWIKFAFENSDATGKSIVSVVTNGSSDDANGVILSNEDSVWLRIIRKGDIYALHWSINGEDFNMARLSTLPSADVVKVGLEAQCPVGKPAQHEFLFFSLEQRTVADLRKGI